MSRHRAHIANIYGVTARKWSSLTIVTACLLMFTGPVYAVPFTTSDVIAVTDPTVNLARFGGLAAIADLNGQAAAGKIKGAFVLGETATLPAKFDKAPYPQITTFLPEANTAAAALQGLALGVPANTMSTKVEFTEVVAGMTIVSERFDMDIANNVATFSFAADPAGANENTHVAAVAGAQRVAEGTGLTFQEITGNLFAGVAAQNAPFRVFVWSDCTQASPEQVCAPPDFNNPEALPEPATLLVLSMGLLFFGVVGTRARRRHP